MLAFSQKNYTPNINILEILHEPRNITQKSSGTDLLLELIPSKFNITKIIFMFMKA